MLKPEVFQISNDPWEIVFQLKERNKALTGYVVGLEYPGDIPTWVLSFEGLEGIKGLVPVNEAGVDKSVMPQFVGQQVRVKIKGFDKENGIIACSRKEAVLDALEQINFTEGQIIDVAVRGFLGRDQQTGRPPRLLVDIGGGVLVEIPRSLAARSLTKPLREQYAVGKTIKAKVIKIENGLPVLSVREAYPDPWEKADYKRGAFISGRVFRVGNSKTGQKLIWIEPDMTPGILGIANYPFVGDVKVGDRVNCAVASFNKEEKKLRLRLRGW